MDIKTHLKQLIENETDAGLLEAIRTILERTGSFTVKTELTNDEKSAIDKGLRSVNEGKVSSNDEVFSSIRDKYPNL